MQLRTLFEGDRVRRRIDCLAGRVAADCADRRPLLLWIAEGARRFARALAAGLEGAGLEPELRCVRARRTRGTTLREVELEAFDTRGLRGRDVLVVDDISDEGCTLRAVCDRARRAGARSLRTAVLVDKTERRREPIALDYVGFSVSGGWIVGFGMDLDGRFRELDAIAVAEPEHP